MARRRKVRHVSAHGSPLLAPMRIAGADAGATSDEGPPGVGPFPLVAPTSVGSGAVATGADGPPRGDADNPCKSNAAPAPFVLKLGHAARLKSVACGPPTDVPGGAAAASGTAGAGASAGAGAGDGAGEDVSIDASARDDAGDCSGAVFGAGAGVSPDVGAGAGVGADAMEDDGPASATEAAAAAGAFSPTTTPVISTFSNTPVGAATLEVAAAATTAGARLAPEDESFVLKLGALRRWLLPLFVCARAEDLLVVSASLSWRTLARFPEASGGGARPAAVAGGA